MPRNCLVINLDRCTGCDSCIISCKLEHGLGLGIYFNRVLQVGPSGTYPNIERYNLPVQCQQCSHARCVEVCPTGASYRNEIDGTIQVDTHKCVGCQYCLYACPYGVRIFDEAEGVAKKCTLCQHLTADGKSKPACVHNCPGGARFFGDLDDPASDVSRELGKYSKECIHFLPQPQGESPLTRYILSPKYASWKDLV